MLRKETENPRKVPPDADVSLCQLNHLREGKVSAELIKIILHP